MNLRILSIAAALSITSAFASGARADVAPPNDTCANNASVGDKCSNYSQAPGLCEKATCSRKVEADGGLSYQNYACLQCFVTDCTNANDEFEGVTSCVGANGKTGVCKSDNTCSAGSAATTTTTTTTGGGGDDTSGAATGGGGKGTAPTPGDTSSSCSIGTLGGQAPIAVGMLGLGLVALLVERRRRRS